MNINIDSNTVIVLDFETTGLSADYGDRAIEIGAVKIVEGEPVDRFQQLMYPGKRINSFIEDYTGITNMMLKEAPSSAKVMKDFSKFIEGFNLVAHNASFDSKFLSAEFKRVKKKVNAEFACSMLISRRIYPEAPNHQLATLVEYKDLPNEGVFHRALADAEMTTHLWLSLVNDIKDRHSFDELPFKLMLALSRVPKKSVTKFLSDELSKLQ